MATIIAQNRKELRASIGRNLRAIHFGTCTAAGSTSTWKDAELENADDYVNGRWWLATSGNNDGSVRPVDDYTGSTTTGNLRGDVLGTATADGDTYELWDRDVPPGDVHDAINRSIRAVPRKAGPLYSDESVHTAKSLVSYSIPSTFTGLNRVEYLSGETGETLHECDVLWDELVDADVTAVLDDEDCRNGAASCRFQVAADLAANDIIASDSISSTDLSGYTHVEFWMKSTVATSTGDLTLRLSASASAAAGTDDLSVPALTANTWKCCKVALGNPHLDTAIISIGLIDGTDIGAAYVWVDHIRAVVDNTGSWNVINAHHWRVDSDARELVFSPVVLPGYNWLKLTGAKFPTECSAEATDCDIDPEYIIAQATAFVMRSLGERSSVTRAAAISEANAWEAIAMRRAARLPTPQGMRWIET